MAGESTATGTGYDPIDAAVAWWAGRLRSTPQQDNGDDTQSRMLTRQSLTVPRPSEEQIMVFSERLGRSLVGPVGQSGRTAILDADYSPCPLLGDAARAAGISSALFPVKTTMVITPEGITVKNGYGASWETVFPAESTQEAGASDAGGGNRGKG